ncbi:abortive infection system antitoxin AbiGi family protein [Enterococcus raffinosus]|uniref:abortive infection system antitoxin AbiGi family protein n=1 Tax=Enterococcus raffinosus TaxID=71452 RepID=UPI002890C64E|nr:abortive infection system antitoxin AbiGi family protein [Enterococcus raffinosus]MDT2555503.1 abortive infection system antitoxin AbiGi family protein [Enterococcus raffinosus]
MAIETKTNKFDQSANSVFHFTDKLEYVENILMKSRISPRYVIEDMEYLKFPLFKELAIPMSCFCDIRLHSIVKHVNFYGFFGIGFQKKWIIDHGIQPIHYLNTHSMFTNDFKNELNTLLDSDFEIPDQNKDYIFKKLFYVKPLYGTMRDKNLNKTVQKNFHDENEWRFVPKIVEESNYKPFIAVGGREPINNDNYRATLNKALSLDETMSLHFSYEDINYLFVSDDVERIKLIDFIFSELVASEDTKRLLVSKIQTINQIKEDF